MSEARTYVRLIVRSDSVSPDEVSRQVGMDGDRLERKGEIRTGLRAKNREHQWVRNSRLPPDMSLDDHLRSLLEDLSPVRDRVASLKDCDVAVSCVLYGDQEPILGFEREIVTGIHSLGAALDIDVVVWRGRE